MPDAPHGGGVEMETRGIAEMLERCKVLGISATRYLFTHSEVTALIAAVRADERAQLAARATDQERGMVEPRCVNCDGGTEHGVLVQYFDGTWGHGMLLACQASLKAQKATLLAALTASRERGIEEALAWAFENLPSFTIGLSPGLPMRRTESVEDYAVRGLRALAAPAVADTTAPQRAEGEG